MSTLSGASAGPNLPFRLSIDTGGTFTDAIIADERRIIAVGKSPTTPANIFAGVAAALENAAEKMGLSLGELLAQAHLFVYGTTHGVNAIVQGRTAKTALLTTEGFPDVLLLREGGKQNPHDFSREYPAPYIPRRYTFEICERTTSEGGIERPLDLAQAGKVIETLRRQNFESVAVAFLWSIVNPAHELAMAGLLDKDLPGVPYTLSHKLMPVIREYRRASAAAIDASLKPLMQEHFETFERELRNFGYRGQLVVSTSAGGCLHIADVIEKPITTIKSGPAMAPVAGLAYMQAEALGEDAIVCDTGGTTFDVGLIREGAIAHTRESWIPDRWTGHIIGLSTVDIRSVGAGGGSIAWCDAGGILRLGPQSAGAVPGPACYGNGGVVATVTDAAAILGYLNPEYFLGGRIRLDVDASRKAISVLAESLRLNLEGTAVAILLLANEQMIQAIREVTIREGLDPRESALIAGGGAAGMNIADIGRELGCKMIYLPGTAAVFSASGMQFADVVYELDRSAFTRSDQFDFDGVNATLAKIETELLGFQARLAGSAKQDCEVKFSVEARYLFQVWELEIALGRDRVASPADLAAIVAAFHRTHERVFAVRDEKSPIDFVNWKGRIVSGMKGPKLDQENAAQRPVGKEQARRRMFFPEGAWQSAPIHRSESIEPGKILLGPTVIEDPNTTIVVPPRMSAVKTPLGGLVLMEAAP